MKLLVCLFFLFTCSQALLSLGHVHSEGLHLLQETWIKGVNASVELNQREIEAFYKRLHISRRKAASGGRGQAIRGGGTSIVNSPRSRGTGRSGAPSVLACRCFSNIMVQVSIGLSLDFMFFF